MWTFPYDLQNKIAKNKGIITQKPTFFDNK